MILSEARLHLRRMLADDACWSSELDDAAVNVARLMVAEGANRSSTIKELVGDGLSASGARQIYRMACKPPTASLTVATESNTVDHGHGSSADRAVSESTDLVANDGGRATTSPTRLVGNAIRAFGGFSLAMTGIHLWRVGFPRLEGPEGESWRSIIPILISYLVLAGISGGCVILGNFLSLRGAARGSEPTP